MNYNVESELHANGSQKWYDIYRERKESGFRCAAHIHSYYEIIYCRAGCVDVFCHETEVCRIGAGDLIIIDPNVIHYTSVPSSAFTENLVVKFSPMFFYPENPTPADVRYLFTVRMAKGHYTVIRQGDPAQAEFVTLMENTCKEFEDKQVGYELILRANTCRLYAMWLRYAGFSELRLAEEGEVSSQGAERTARVLSYIEKHYDHPITMADAAEACHMSYSYFSRNFEKWAHMKFNDYLLRLRVNKARKLLLQSDSSVTGIAIDCGFENISYFIKKFRQVTGYTPTEFRKQYKQL